MLAYGTHHYSSRGRSIGEWAGFTGARNEIIYLHTLRGAHGCTQELPKVVLVNYDAKNDIAPATRSLAIFVLAGYETSRCVCDKAVM